MSVCRLCKPQASDIILDPMCGTGAIPLEVRHNLFSLARCMVRFSLITLFFVLLSAEIGRQQPLTVVAQCEAAAVKQAQDTKLAPA